MGICSVYISWAAVTQFAATTTTTTEHVVHSEIHPAIERDTLIPGLGSIASYLPFVPRMILRWEMFVIMTMLFPLI